MAYSYEWGGFCHEQEEEVQETQKRKTTAVTE